MASPEQRAYAVHCGCLKAVFFSGTFSAASAPKRAHLFPKLGFWLPRVPAPSLRPLRRFQHAGRSTSRFLRVHISPVSSFCANTCVSAPIATARCRDTKDVLHNRTRRHSRLQHTVVSKLRSGSFRYRLPVAMAAFAHADVVEVARMLSVDGSTPSFRHGTATNPLSGKQCVIYALGFPNGDSWAVRIPSHTGHLPAAAIANYVEAEARILKDLEASGFSFSPRLLGYSSAFDNPIGFPYLVLTWIEGRPLEWTSAVPAQRNIRDKILHQMADISLELALRTCVEETGKMLAGASINEFLSNSCRAHIDRCGIPDRSHRPQDSASRPWKTRGRTP